MMNTWDETAEKPFLLQIVAGLSQFFLGLHTKWSILLARLAT